MRRPLYYVALVALGVWSLMGESAQIRPVTGRSVVSTRFGIVAATHPLAARAGVHFTDDVVFPVATLCTGSEEAAVRILNGIGAQFRDTAPKHRLSAHQDIDAGRPLEVEETLGHAVRSAARAGLSLPLLDAVYRIAAAIDRAARAP